MDQDLKSGFVSRRSFLGDAAVLSGASIAPKVAVAGQSTGDRLGFGVIGAGARGGYHLDVLKKLAQKENVRLVAASDVFRKRLDGAAERYGVKGYMDYRELLASSDVDAVVIATPDHWHAKMALDALAAGKHVYLEKPMTLTAEEAIAVRNKVKETGRVLQVGPQWTGDDAFWRARDVIRTGRIGKVTWAESGITRNWRTEPFNIAPFVIDPAAGPDKQGGNYINWDMWLGHEFGLAPKIPFQPDHFFRFRKYSAYSAGLGGDMLYHRLAPLLLALEGPDGAYPLRVNCAGGLYIEKDGRDIPDMMIMTLDYPGEYTVVLIASHTNAAEVPTRICGKYGTLNMNRSRLFNLGGEPELSGDGQFGREFAERNNGNATVSLSNDPRRDMTENFIDAIRGKAQLYCNAKLGATTMVGIGMGVESYRKRRLLTWDAKAEEVVG